MVINEAKNKGQMIIELRGEKECVLMANLAASIIAYAPIKKIRMMKKPRIGELTEKNGLAMG